MILLFDVGNTNTKIVLSDGIKILNKIKIKTEASKTPDDYYFILKSFFNIEDIENIVISSVVPKVLVSLEILTKKYFKKTPIVVKSKIKTGIFIIADNPSEVGSDIICNCVGLSDKKEAIIVDLGTANKYIYFKDKKLIGLLISAGAEISLKSLANETALLPNISLGCPKGILGNNTIDCLTSGAIYSLASEIEGITKRIKEHYKSNAKVYLTGGASKLVKDILKIDCIYDEDLTIKGLLGIYNKNKKEK